MEADARPLVSHTLVAIKKLFSHNDQFQLSTSRDRLRSLFERIEDPNGKGTAWEYICACRYITACNVSNIFRNCLSNPRCASLASSRSLLIRSYNDRRKIEIFSIMLTELISK